MRTHARISDRIVLRSRDPAEPAVAYLRNREHLRPWEPFRAPEFFTAEWHRADVVRFLSARDTGTALPLVLADDDRIFGRVGLSGIVRGPLQSADLGYWLEAEQVVVLRAHILAQTGSELIGPAESHLCIAGRWQDHRLFQLILHDGISPIDLTSAPGDASSG